MDFQTVIKSKLTSVGLVIALCAISFITAELYLQKREVDSEVKRLRSQAESLGQNNQQLSELIKYLDTPEYKEKEAREKLNLKKPGEEVVVLPQDNTEGQVAAATTPEFSNPKKWFNYFFSR